MIPISAALKAHLAQPYQTTCTLWLVTLSNSTVLGFTDLDRDIVFNSVTFLAGTGYTRTDIASADDLSVDNMEVDGMINSPSITEDDLRSGIWDFAAIKVSLINWADTSMGELVLRTGHLGQVTLERNTFKAELRGVSQAYSRTIGELTQPGCRALLGDARCKVPMTAPTWLPSHGYLAVHIGDAAIGSIVKPTSYNGRFFLCTTAGTSGGSEPSWNTTVGGTTSDGSVVWTTIYARTVQGTLTGVNADKLTMYDTGRLEPGPTGGIAITNVSNSNPGHVTVADGSSFSNGEAVTLSEIVGPDLLNTVTIIRNLSGNVFDLGIDTSNTGIYPPYVSGGKVTPLGTDSGFFDFGVMTMTSGAASGFSMEVRSYVPGQWILQLPFTDGRFTPIAGDTYTMTVGCDKSLATCKVKFNNVINMRAEPYLPGLDKIVQIGKQA